MFERFTGEARAVVMAARVEAADLGHDSIGPEHLLLALVGPGAGVGSDVLRSSGLEAEHLREAVHRRHPAAGFPTEEDAQSLRSVGIELDDVLARLTESLGPDALTSVPSPARRGRLRFGPTAKKAVQLALREASWLKAGQIASEHLLLGLLRCDDAVVNALLGEFAVTADDLHRATLRAIGRAA